jgi:hypothetical protein
VGIDINRIAVRAIEAAFEDEQPRPKRRHSGLKAVAAGAALVAAARVAVTKAPDMPGLSKLSGAALSRVPDMVRDRLDEYGMTGQAEPAEDELPEEELAEDEEFEEPEAELEEEPEAEFEDEDEEDEPEDDEPEDDEPPEGPEAGAEEEDLPEDEDLDEDEPEAEAPELAVDEDGGGRRTPDVMELMNPHSPPPVLTGARGRSRRRIRPAARPPAPPRRGSEEERR